MIFQPLLAIFLNFSNSWLTKPVCYSVKITRTLFLQHQLIRLLFKAKSKIHISISAIVYNFSQNFSNSKFTKPFFVAQFNYSTLAWLLAEIMAFQDQIQNPRIIFFSNSRLTKSFFITQFNRSHLGFTTTTADMFAF